VEASDDVAKKYYEKTRKEDRSDSVVTAIMRAATRNKH
jgi:hypothetical protein